MAIYRLEKKSISRGNGHNLAAAIGYRAGLKITDHNPKNSDRTTHDYSKKSDVAHSEIILTDELKQAGVQLDFEQIANLVEIGETTKRGKMKKNAKLASEYVLAGSHELSLDENIQAFREFAEQQSKEQGVIAMLFVHDPKLGNDVRASKDGQSLLAVNDLFIGPKSHTSAQYILQWNGAEEVQSSSGIIVSTGLGSTGWFQSILAGAMAITGEASHPLLQGFSWSDRKLQFSVREPFPSRTTGVALTFGTIEPDSPLQLGSLMPENGVIFSDGIEDDYLQFNAGCIAHIGIADIQGQLISQKGRQRI